MDRFWNYTEKHELICQKDGCDSTTFKLVSPPGYMTRSYIICAKCGHIQRGGRGGMAPRRSR